MPATFSRLEADRAFAAVRRSALACTRVRAEVPLDAIRGTLEPHRATQFDRGFRPARSVRERWERVWLAEARGAVLPRRRRGLIRPSDTSAPRVPAGGRRRSAAG